MLTTNSRDADDTIGPACMDEQYRHHECEGERRFLACVIRHAVIDIAGVSYETTEHDVLTAKQFLFGYNRGLGFYCAMLGLSPELIREKARA